MKKIAILTVASFLLTFGHMANAAEGVSAMIGKWIWNDFTIVVKKCPKTEICAKVVSGPKNVGMEMIRSNLQPRGKIFVGKIAHPQTGGIYNSKLTLTDANTWKLDGCTDKNVCATGTFTRIK